MKIQFKKHPLLYTSVLCWLVGFPVGLVVEGNDNVSIPRTNTVKCNFDFIVYALNELQETISLTIPEIKFLINQSCKIEIANKEILKKYKK